MKQQGIVEETTDLDERLTVEIDCFLCTISLEVMEDPVVTIYGHSYHRANIEGWLDSHTSDPNTNQPLTKAQLFPNFNLKSAIEAWKKLDSQWEKHAAVYKIMQAEKKLQHMKISDLEVEKAEYEEKIKQDIEAGKDVSFEDVIFADEKFTEGVPEEIAQKAKENLDQSVYKLEEEKKKEPSPDRPSQQMLQKIISERRFIGFIC